MKKHHVPIRLGESKKQSPKLSHEEIADHIAAYEARGKHIEQVPGFVQSVRPRASWSWGQGAGAQ